MNFLKFIKNIFVKKEVNFFPPVYKEDGKKTKIIVALSGGVDSSVVLAMLKEKGYSLKGIYFKTYKPDGDKTYCKKEGTDAKKICKSLNVPFEAFDLQKEYKEFVFDYMIGEYKKGKTPNPDIYCNKYIKFGIFLEKSLGLRADFIATGHYATHVVKQNKHYLVKALDQNKDQTYFLSQISKEALEKTIFPIGDFKKDKVRQKAKKYGLFTFNKKDSQGICFMQKEVDLKKFLQKYIEKKEGDVLNTSGDVVGRHDGVVFYTIGQRHGFTILPEFKTPNQERLFVVQKDFKKNILVVGNRSDLEKHKNIAKKNIIISDLNLFNEVNLEKAKNLTGRIRHRGELIKINKISQKQNSIEIQFQKPHTAVASGQFLAIYQNNICLGGGVIVY